MIISLQKLRQHFLAKLAVCFINLIFVFGLCLPAVPVHAQTTVVPMPAPGTMVTTTHSFTPPMLRGVMINPDQPFRFDFLVDTGNTNIKGQALEEESVRLIKYFLASLTVPEQDLWVNLSPFEKQRIIPEQFGVTEMGRDLLAQDYLLKQLTATLMYPEDELGHKFWDKVYKESQARFGTTEIPVNTFNKVWIIPDKAVVYEQGTSAFVVETHLKVMLEQDYLALDKNVTNQLEEKPAGSGEETEVNRLASDIIREVLIPAIEKEVNEGEHFASLRQIYNSLILATWYKETLKESLINQLYSDQNKVAGVDVEDKEVKEKIYQKYIQAFKEGVYDYIKEEFDPVTQELIPRKYFSGGMKMGLQTRDVIQRTKDGSDFAILGNAERIEADFRSTEPVIGELSASDQAVLAVQTRQLESVEEKQTALDRWFKGDAKRTFTRSIWEMSDVFGKKNFLFALEVQGEVVGLVRYRKGKFPSVDDDGMGLQDVYTVDYVEVDQAYRKRGYLNVLLAEAISASFNDTALSEEMQGMIVANPADKEVEATMRKRGFAEIPRGDLEDYEPDERQRQRNFYLSSENARDLWAEAQVLKAGNGTQLELFPDANAAETTDAAVLSWESYVPGGIIENPSWSRDNDYVTFSMSTLGGRDEVSEMRLVAWQRYIPVTNISIPKQFERGLVVGFGDGTLELLQVKQQFQVGRIDGVDWVGPRVRSTAATLADKGVSAQDVTLHHADARNLREVFADGSFDFVYAGAISPDSLTASSDIAKEIVRVLRPGGTALLDEGNPAFLDVLRQQGAVQRLFSTTYHVFTKTAAPQAETEDVMAVAATADSAVLVKESDVRKLISDAPDLKSLRSEEWAFTKPDIEQIVTWLTAGKSDEYLNEPQLKKLFVHISTYYQQGSKELASRWLKTLANHFQMDVGQLDTMVKWFAKSKIDLKKVSAYVLKDFVRQYIENYKNYPNLRKSFVYLFPLEADDNGKLQLAANNMRRMTQMFSANFINNKSIMKAPIEGTDYFIGIQYGLAESTHGLYVGIGKEQNGVDPLAGIFIRLGLDTQGDDLRVNMMQGVSGRQDIINLEAPEVLGMHPAVALLYIALQAARQGPDSLAKAQFANNDAFEALMGIRPEHIPTMKNGKPTINILANYERFGLRRSTPFSRWQNLQHLSETTLPARLEREDVTAKTIQSLLNAFSNLEEIDVNVGNGEALDEDDHRIIVERTDENADGGDKAVLARGNSPEEINRVIGVMVEKGILPAEMAEMARRDNRIGGLIAQNALFENGRLKSSVDEDTVGESLDLLSQREEEYLNALKQHIPEIITYARWLLDNPKFSGKKLVSLGRATDPIHDALVALTYLDSKYENRRGDILTLDFSSDQISEANVDIEAYGELVRNQLVQQGASLDFDNVVFVNEVTSMAGLSEQYLRMFLGENILYTSAVSWQDSDEQQGVRYDGRTDNLEWANWLDNDFNSGRRYEILMDGDEVVSQIYTEDDALQRFINQQAVYDEVIKSTPNPSGQTTSDFAVMGSSSNKKYVKFLPLLFGFDLFSRRITRTDELGKIYQDILREAFPDQTVDVALGILGYYITYGREPANAGFTKSELYNKLRMIFFEVMERTGEDLIRSSVLNTIISGDGIWVNLPVEASGETMWNQLKLNETVQSNYRILLFARGLNNLFSDEEVSQIESDYKGRSPFNTILTLGAFFPKGAPESQKTELSRLIEELKEIFQTDGDIDLAKARSIAEYLVSRYATNLNESINMEEVDVIVPVPSSRQFNNQIVPLASAISERYNKPVSQNAISKIRRTQQQKTMNGAWKRIANMAGVNIANPQLVAGKTVLIVDDVVTSGTSLYEAQRALMEAGAKKVYMVGFGLTQTHKNRTRVTMKSNGTDTTDSAILGTAHEVELFEQFRQILGNVKYQNFVDSAAGLVQDMPLESLKELLVANGFTREAVDRELSETGQVSLRVLNVLRLILNRQGFSDLLDLRPVNNGLLAAPYVGHDMGVKLSVNPEDKPLVGVYGAAGVDVSNFFLSTNAKEGYFVSPDYTLSALGPSVGRNPLVRYKDSKYSTGYTVSDNDKFTALSYFDALLVELEAIGVSMEDLDQIEAQREEFGKGRVTTINFKWGYLGQEPTERIIHFVTGDMTQPASIADVIPQQVDFYYQRAGVDLPSKYNLFLGWLAERVARNGFLVLDNYSYDVVAEQTVKFNPQDTLAGVIETQDKGNFNMDYWGRLIPNSPKLRLRIDYGANVQVLQKTSDVSGRAPSDSAKLPSADIRTVYDAYVESLGNVLNEIQRRRSGSDVWFIFDNQNWDQLPGNVMARNERTGEVFIHLHTDEGDLTRGFMFRVNPNAAPGQPIFDQFFIEQTSSEGFVNGEVLVERGFITREFADQILADASSAMGDYRRDDIRRLNFIPLIRDVAQNKAQSTDFVFGVVQDENGRDLFSNIFKRSELSGVDADGRLRRSTVIGETPIDLDFTLANGTTAQTKETPTGGIDLTPNNLNLDIRRDQNSGVQVPLTPQQLEGINIQGLYPVIINITPVSNVPLLLGIADRPEEPSDISIRPALDPIDRKDLAEIPEKISLLK